MHACVTNFCNIQCRLQGLTSWQSNKSKRCNTLYWIECDEYHIGTTPADVAGKIDNSWIVLFMS